MEMLKLQCYVQWSHGKVNIKWLPVASTSDFQCTRSKLFIGTEDDEHIMHLDEGLKELSEFHLKSESHRMKLDSGKNKTSWLSFKVWSLVEAQHRSSQAFSLEIPWHLIGNTLSLYWLYNYCKVLNVWIIQEHHWFCSFRQSDNNFALVELKPSKTNQAADNAMVKVSCRAGGASENSG